MSKVINDLSVRSLSCEPLFNDAVLSSATSFVVKWRNTHFLITNKHVVTAKNPTTGEHLHRQLAVPNEMRVWHNADAGLGVWRDVIYPLVSDDGRPTWLEHPSKIERIDVVALPLAERDDIALYPYDLEAGELDCAIRVGGDLFVIGFPFGRSLHGKIPLWTRGSVASEPELDWDDLPSVLVDARTRPGQSGSPVVCVNTSGVYVNTSGDMCISGHDIGKWKLVGVYSGRINEESDLGTIWKRGVLEELLSSGATPSAPAC